MLYLYLGVLDSSFDKTTAIPIRFRYFLQAIKANAKPVP
jgi:hypothetical protein